MPYDRDAILVATDLAALCDELLGPHGGRGRSMTWRCPNPAHAQSGRTPPLGLYRGRRGLERWRCHGCGAGGTALDLVMIAQGVPVRDALAALARRAGMAERGWQRPSPPRAAAVRQDPVLADPEGLASYVEQCAARLWRPDGRAVRHWLVGHRGIGEGVLERNRVGADPGAHRQARPQGVAKIVSRAAVFPVLDAGLPTFVQLRLLHPGKLGLRYLNPSCALGPNPKVALYEPTERAGECVVVTEGPTDGLSVAAAGYRVASVLGTGSAASPAVVERLAALGAHLVVVFDANSAGRDGVARVVPQLRARKAPVSVLHVPFPHDDVNDWMRASPEWAPVFQAAVRGAVLTAVPGLDLALGR